MKALRIHIRVILALVLRESRVRHGRSRAGYTWAIVEPVLQITILTLLFREFRGGTGGGTEFAIFFATGVLSFNMFKNTAGYVMHAFEQNRPLFNYPMVKPVDSVLARVLLDVATNLLIMFIVISFQVFVLGAPGPKHVPLMALPLFLLASMALGAGLSLAVIRRFLPSILNFYHIIMGPAFFVSCIFYSMSSIPTRYRELLAWNPLVHGIEGFRIGYFAEYSAPDVDLFYLFTWVAVLNCFGFVGEKLTRFRQQ
ncbi:ABC transporter permease [Maritimibacter sp. UBA3975]|uniref:ABC transporter permease n=1 Tax=Maritimibacter sp. UBA3975 TaxID=1946833 RepID=UPI000C0AF181|nr:ABC transporter permease [Maritimibacter sp. UBA3975]MAM62870.1 ABC transporter [Maritimibacter sp.]|tara:strand:- start:59610 stop:60374 length:765 start_codon:yes stop_codon:yes gene_type:complete